MSVPGWRVRPVSCLLVAALIVVLASAVASAGTPGFWWNGGDDYGAWYGAQGNIECDPVVVYRDSSIWIMVFGSGGTDYIQVGWLRKGGYTTNKHFYEWSSSITGAWFFWEPSQASTGTHSYKLDRVSDVWSIYINGAKQAHTVNHATTLKWSPAGGEFSGEVHDDWDDQTPGTNADPITMGYLKRKNSSGTWSTVSLDATFADLSHQRNNADVGDSTFEQWDSRY